MGVLRHLSLKTHHRLSAATAFAFLFLACATALSFSHPPRNGLVSSKQERGRGGTGRSLESLALEQFLSRRRLNGPGSSPPTCRSKCGRCFPCKPVHVPIQPGRTMPLEYYPEAWRCKCGNKLFMP